MFSIDHIRISLHFLHCHLREIESANFSSSTVTNEITTQTKRQLALVHDAWSCS